MGEPRWRLVHPVRQREAMLRGLCQVCARPARTELGFVFLAGPGDYAPHDTVVTACQPPVCPPHAAVAAALCPHLAGDPVVFLAASCPLYGVLGTPYEFDAGELQALPSEGRPVPYGDPRLDWFLASQLARRLRTFTRIDLAEARALGPRARADGLEAPRWAA
ncbi:hypothetical protein [Streptomyces sp. CC224B]|uniref:hypothetical protein n=1 Tax=Streptomyces sp. CC224B TaxID=3044571 RepID=UPI0024A7B280|nr:hypothetical protein [Streptomyces sp. CC224B]